MTSGERLKNARNHLHLTQAEFGRRIDCTGEKIKNIEMGRTKLTAGIALKIQENLGVSFKWLLEEEGEMLISSAMENKEIFESLPDPVKKTVELMQQNPDMAWELYALALERIKSRKK